ncbi:MAG: tetratricopeptide repeat protein [Maricaulaceae bacterium]|nr:tetratricopeptide repeat protein [Maricaulaceae bacterium]
MRTDRQENPLPGASAEGAALYDEAMSALNLYAGDPLALLDGALEIDPDFAMAHLARAHVLALATEPEAAAMARDSVAAAKALDLDDRSASHAAALDRALAGEWTAAALALDAHNARFPRDLLALQAGHVIDFLRGNARNLRDRIARALPRWTPDVPGYSLLLGMHAFGLEEMGDYDRADEAGRRALELEPRDSWAHHAVAHVIEMQGRAGDGVAWMRDREEYWAAEDNFFRVHNWWHRALCHIDLDEAGAALALYDGPVRGAKSAVALDLVDASALLWRLEALGVDVGGRWGELATAWEQHADGRLYAFNDWHAAMAYLGAGRDTALDRLLAACREDAVGGSEAARWRRETGLALIEGFAAFHHGRYEEAVERLHPARFIANGFGGSHAQRDIIDWTLTEAAIRGGLRGLAEGLAGERLALKPFSPVNRAFQKRARALAH